MLIFKKKILDRLSLNGLIFSTKKSTLDLFTLFALALFPLLYLTLRSWTNSFLFILFVISLVYTFKNFSSIKNGLSDIESKLITLTLCLPVLAIFISQLFRQDFSINAFDGPSRILLAALIFLYLRDRQIHFTKALEWVLPVSLLICLAAYIFNPEASALWDGRAASYFVDTITFGTYCTIIGFICLISIESKHPNSNIFLNILKVLAFLIGCYIAIQSQSRTAWTAAIGLFCYWFMLRFYRKPSHLWILFFLVACAITLIYKFSPSVYERINLGVYEVSSYFTEGNFDTSLGLRISMIRVACILILENPLAGLKDGIIPALHTIDSIQPFYTELLQYMITNTGTHTEILAQGVRSGIWGIFSATALFFVPGIVFYRRLKNPNPKIRAASVAGFTLVLGLFIASLTIQVFNLKYNASFYSLMIAALAAQALPSSETNSQ